MELFSNTLKSSLTERFRPETKRGNDLAWNPKPTSKQRITNSDTLVKKDLNGHSERSLIPAIQTTRCNTCLMTYWCCDQKKLSRMWQLLNWWSIWKTRFLSILNSHTEQTNCSSTLKHKWMSQTLRGTNIEIRIQTIAGPCKSSRIMRARSTTHIGKPILKNYQKLMRRLKTQRKNWKNNASCRSFMMRSRRTWFRLLISMTILIKKQKENQLMKSSKRKNMKIKKLKLRWIDFLNSKRMMLLTRKSFWRACMVGNWQQGNMAFLWTNRSMMLLS